MYQTSLAMTTTVKEGTEKTHYARHVANYIFRQYFPVEALDGGKVIHSEREECQKHEK
jgi:hypothetical protein